jgi:hypothetical protein
MAAYFDKTEKGREEIATRKYQLGLRLRSLLLVVDGKHGTEDILGKFQGTGLGEQSFAELLEQGFIHKAVAEPPQAGSPAASQVASQVAAHANQQPVASEAVPSTGESQYQSLYHFYTETIKSTLGLRGYGLQLKVERAATVEDFRALRDPYVKAVEKARGQEMARSLGDRLDKLLNGEAGPRTKAIPA